MEQKVEYGKLDDGASGLKYLFYGCSKRTQLQRGPSLRGSLTSINNPLVSSKASASLEIVLRRGEELLVIGLPTPPQALVLRQTKGDPPPPELGCPTDLQITCLLVLE